MPNVDLRELNVRVEHSDEDMAVLRGVPTNPAYYNKPRTSLLVKRARAGQPFFVCGDADLEYRGPDPGIAKVFAGGVVREGWRFLLLDPGLTVRDAARIDREDVLDRALTMLGSRGETPALPDPIPPTAPEPGAGLLDRFGVSLTRLVSEDAHEPTVGRSEEIEDVATACLAWGQSRFPVILGPSGTGKTNLLHGVAALLAEARPDLDLVRVSLPGLFAGTLFEAERENLLAGLLTEAATRSEILVALEPLGPALGFAAAAGLLVAGLEEGARLIGTGLPSETEPLGAAPLVRRVRPILLRETSPAGTMAVVAAVLPRLAGHHGVEVPEGSAAVAVRAAARLPGLEPARTIALLDAAASRAALLGLGRLEADEIFHAASRLAGKAGR